MTRSGAPTDWEASLGKFCEVLSCTSLARHVIDGEYRCGRHTKSKSCPRCGKTYLRKRVYTGGGVCYVHAEELRKGRLPHMAITEYCMTKAEARRV